MTLNCPVINGLYDSQVSRTYITNAKCECSTAIYIPNSLGQSYCFFFFVFSFQIATLLEQDRANARAVVNLIVTKEILKLDFDDLCEYIGEIEDL